MTVLYNLARVSTATTGTGTITLGSAITGYLTFAQAGVTDGTVVSYGIRDGANSEVGTGTYTASGTTLTRNVLRSTVAPNYNTAITLSGSAEVYITALSEDILNKTTSNTMLGALTLPNTGLKVQDTDASNVLSVVPGSNLSADRTLTWTTGDADRNITLTGNTTIPATFPTSTTDNSVPRFDGTAGSFQTSLLAVDDSGNLTGATSIDIGNADTTISRASAGVIAVEGSNVLMASNIGSSVQGYNANLADLTTSYGRATAAGPASLKLYEDTDNGSQYVELIAPNSIVTSNKQASLQDVTGTIYISNGQDVAIADGGTGASDVATARSNLGLGSLATLNSPLPVANGGTGQTTYTNGQLLIGNNSGGLTQSTLTQGSGITITNGDGSITIASTGSMVYPGAGIPNSTGSAWGTSYTTSGSGTVVALATSPSFTTPVLGTPTSGNLSNCTADGTSSVGFRNIPQNIPGSWPYTLVLADSGKHIINTGGSGVTATIPANASVAYVLGTAVTFVNTGAGAMTISINSDTLYLAGTGSTGSRTLAQWGVATAIKVTSTSWVISGTNLT